MPIHKIKQYKLRRVVGMEDASVHVLFPGLSNPRSPSSRLSSEDFGRWMDQIFLPALCKSYSAHHLQHYPSSYAHALMNSCVTWSKSRFVTTQRDTSSCIILFHRKGLQLHGRRYLTPFSIKIPQDSDTFNSSLMHKKPQDGHQDYDLAWYATTIRSNMVYGHGLGAYYHYVLRYWKRDLPDSPEADNH